jgi:hypothetical protein
MYTGVLIKESLLAEDVLDMIEIQKVELWPAPNHVAGQSAYWTAIHFSSENHELPGMLSNALKDALWYVDMREDNTHTVVVLQGMVIRYPFGNKEGKEKAREACKKAGIPETQLDWPD